MSKMACTCGGTIRDHLIPCPTEGWVLRDQDQETYADGTARDIVAFFAAAREGRRDAWLGEYFSPQYPNDVGDEGVVHDILAVHQRRVLLSLAECEQCGRLWLQRGPGINSYRGYAPEVPGYVGMLRSAVPDA
jgi:hypothetical protein